MEPEQIISNFLKPPSEGGSYTDERLAMLLAHVEDGKFSFVSCCCVKGTVTARHALRGRMEAGDAAAESHLWEAGDLPGANAAEAALKGLLDDDLSDKSAQAVMLPLVRAEISRRESSRSQTEVSEMVMV